MVEEFYVHFLIPIVLPAAPFLARCDRCEKNNNVLGVVHVKTARKNTPTAEIIAYS